MENFSTEAQLNIQTELQPNYRMARAEITQLSDDNPPEYEIIVTELRHVTHASLSETGKLPSVSRTYRVDYLMEGLPDVLDDIRDDTAFNDGLKSSLQEVVRRVVFAAVDEQRKKESD